MKKFAIITFIGILMLAGCGGPTRNLSREEWVGMVSHTFPKTNINDVLKAGEQVIRLSDEKFDVDVYHLPNKMIGTRRFMIYGVLFLINGSYNFDFTAEQKDENVNTILMIGRSDSPFVPSPTFTPGINGGTGGIGVGFSSNTNLGYPVNYIEAYNLFYGRVEALLYKKSWVSCEELTKNLEQKSVLDALCLHADDSWPVDNDFIATRPEAIKPAL